MSLVRPQSVAHLHGRLASRKRKQLLGLIASNGNEWGHRFFPAEETPNTSVMKCPSPIRRLRLDVLLSIRGRRNAKLGAG